MIGKSTIRFDTAARQTLVETRLGSPLPTKYTFTGQYSNVTDFGLMYYNARFYDPQLGRWLSPDTIVPEGVQGTQAWDRYAYVNNSPVNFNDPSGHCPWCFALGVAGAVVGVGLYTLNVVRAEQDWDIGEALATAAVGAGAGALIGTGVGAPVGSAAFSAIATSAGVGMAFGSGGYLAMNSITRTGYQVDNFAIAAAAGGVGGALGQAGISTSLIGNVALNGGGNVIQYGASEISDGRLPTPTGVAWAGFWGMVGGGIGGAKIPIDDLTVHGSSGLGFDLDNANFRSLWQSSLLDDAVGHAQQSAAATAILYLPDPMPE